MGKRGTQPWDHRTAPLGAIRIRRDRKQVHYRAIKVRLDGPSHVRWMRLARYWWLTHRGPVPDGMRVIHADGDTLNDNPENYRLATADDVLCLARTWDADVDRRAAEAHAEAAAAHNRERSRVIRAVRYLPRHWYAVRLDFGLVLNEPETTRVQLYRRLAGVDDVDGRRLIPYWLGWPGVGAAEACILAVLVDGRERSIDEILQDVTAFRQRNGWETERLLRVSIIKMLYRLRCDGFVVSSGPRCKGRVHAILPAALEARRPFLVCTAMRGKRLAAECRAFEKCRPTPAKLRFFQPRESTDAHPDQAPRAVAVTSPR